MELAFVVGPLGAPAVALLAMLVLFIRPSPAWLRRVGVAAVVLTAIAWLTYWYFWGVGFDAANAEVDPRQSTERALTTSMLASVVGTAALAAIVTAAYRRPPHHSSRSVS